MNRKKKIGLLTGLACAAIAVTGVITLRPDAQGQSSESGMLGNLGDAEGDSASPNPGGAKTPDSLAGRMPSAGGAPPEVPSDSYPSLDWFQDPELDSLRMEVYKAELRARFLKATAEIREYEKRLSGKPVKESEASKPVAPPKPKPKLKLIAVDGKGALVEVDGKTYSFAKAGDQEGKVTLKGVTSDRALIEVDGEEYEARF